MEFVVIATLAVLALVYFTIIRPLFAKRPETLSVRKGESAEEILSAECLAMLLEHEEEFKSGKMNREDYLKVATPLKRKLIELAEPEKKATDENTAPLHDHPLPEAPKQNAAPSEALPESTTPPQSEPEITEGKEKDRSQPLASME